ncbi:MAG: polyribonucleotide nucleotidyltransferase [Spirochaetes bacterium GWD1_61_31]|nr:MAG: polyribonucleotide nucleotidyltransferase [Spirochaetes bacterium GWB1_60_80]OHD35129.1 MAG: polyribonucleotide nucleotidyltransferase [Spirochaetes bacterium GWC1_61_12]OHD43648.1 MAG: polyribonucleotide nucleotidyltransferase [Spirochaetes bacterium GWD1_61_31]OHD44139.1 MAG: polyribonucleotide nucleotidyltransferase [Spirochaetes bacterium GWE1_60_18]OHD61873.1 MAG: polyribonucleotide nucleotidyltransferase [Spirochaetes bacterium GWF1_60_12]HAW85088.1 polyribonucleotide nucleotidyl
MIQTNTYAINGEDMVFETGRMARQANGAILARFGGSAVIATACCSAKSTEGLDFVPLTVEYNEKYYAAGKIPGGFIKRESRPKDREILVSRLIDRPMRPLFDKAFGRELQVVPTVISADQINPPDILAINAASAAVHISDIPFDGPIAAVRVCYLAGTYIINPSYEQIEKGSLEIVVAGTKGGITMVEGGADEVSEELMLGAIEAAKKPIAEICAMIEDMRAKVGKAKLPLNPLKVELVNQAEIDKFARPRLATALFTKEKMERYAAVAAAIQQTVEAFPLIKADDMQQKLFNALMEDIQYHVLRSGILDKSLRVDGRGTEDIRPINCLIGILPRTHGSALFTRGETQALAVTTLGTVFDEQIFDDIEGDRRERFMLHYNFPPFSVGEVGRLGTGRREIGHGHLARRALERVLPAKEKFPYTIRVVSEILESNGSSSMASVCGGTLSMLAAGVPLKRPVAGIAMGLITEGNRFAVLSDILGDEDHLGDMDFKVAGTEQGITGFQMDIKIAGVSTEILTKALAQAKQGRLHILGIMNQTISVPSAEISVYAPKIVSMKIEIDKIGAVIGPGGKNIKALCEQFDVKINIDDDGSVTVYGANQKSSYEARDAIRAIVDDPEVGRIYQGTVKRVMDFGCFVEILPGKEGLVHISKLSRQRVNAVTDVVSEGMKIPVKLLEVDKLGRLNLSYVDALESAPGGQ